MEGLTWVEWGIQMGNHYRQFTFDEFEYHPSKLCRVVNPHWVVDYCLFLEVHENVLEIVLLLL